MLTVTDGGCVVVRSREQWSELMHAVPEGARYVVVDAPSGEVIAIRNVGSLKVVVEGDSTVYSNGVDLRVRGCARAYVSGQAFVMALGNARVWASGDVRVAAHDEVRVWANGACVVDAYEKAHVVAGNYVTVYKRSMFGQFRGRVEGGRVVVKHDATDMDGEQWCRVALVHVDDEGMAHLFKATDGEGESLYGGVYRVGEVTDDTDNWMADRLIGYGLHVSPSPMQALMRSMGLWSRGDARFFEVTCPVSELIPLADDMCKCPRVRVVREVDACGEPL